MPQEPEFIAFDWCGWDFRYGRFTHCPSGKTLTQQAWMGQLDWDKKQLEWFETFTGTLVVHNNYQSGPYRETGDTRGTVAEIVTRLRTRFQPEPT